MHPMTDDQCDWVIECFYGAFHDERDWQQWEPSHRYNLNRGLEVMVGIERLYAAPDLYDKGGHWRLRNISTGEIIPLEALGI